MTKKSSKKGPHQIFVSTFKELTDDLDGQFQKTGSLALNGRSAEILLSWCHTSCLLLEMFYNKSMRLEALRKFLGIKIKNPHTPTDPEGKGDEPP